MNESSSGLCLINYWYVFMGLGPQSGNQLCKWGIVACSRLCSLFLSSAGPDGRLTNACADSCL